MEYSEGINDNGEDYDFSLGHCNLEVLMGHLRGNVQ